MKWKYSLRETILADPPAGGAPPAPAPAPPPAVVAPDWVTGLADETLRADKTLAQYKTPEDAYRGLIDTKKAYGAKVEGLVKLPPADAKLDAPEVVAYRTAAGIPLTAAGYKDVAIPPTAIATMSPEGVKAFIETVALPGEGMTVAKVQQAVNFLAEWNEKQQLAFRQGLVARQADLHKKWGANWNREIGLGKRALDQVEAEAGMSKEWRGLLESTGLNEHPDFILMAAYMGRNLFEQGIIPGHVEGALTREEYQDKMNLIRQDPKHAFNNPGHKDHKAAQDEMEGLLRAVAPGER